MHINILRHLETTADMQDAAQMRSETAAYPAMRAALFTLLDSFTQHARTT